MLRDVLLNYGGEEKTGLYLYADIFDLYSADCTLQNFNQEVKNNQGNPIILYQDDTGRVIRRIMFKDVFEIILSDAQSSDFAILNGCCYFGRANKLKNLSSMKALIFDLDGIDDSKLNDFLFGCINGFYPTPNYIILSSNNVHLYYLFEDELSFNDEKDKEIIKELKYKLTEKMWNRYTSILWDKPQYHGITQGFRVVGMPTKSKEDVVRAFKMPVIKYDLETLASFVDFDVSAFNKVKKGRIRLEEAKALYPEWYKERIIKKRKRGTFVVNRDLYDWWIGKIKSGATIGHRYYCCMVLASYAKKCGITYDELKNDMYDLLPYLNGLSVNEDNLFEEKDIKSALRSFNDDMITFPIDSIVKLTNIKIEKNKRNFRQQHIHLKIARATQEILDPQGSWRYKPPTKQQLVKNFLEDNSNKKYNVSEVVKKLGITRPTFYKWRKEWEREQRENENN